MRSATLDWEVELAQWLEPFLDRLGHKARRRMCPLYVTGLIGPGDRGRIALSRYGCFFYRCPNTGLRVQGWLADEPAQHGEHYKLVNCLACGGMHLVNPVTGKTLADDDENIETEAAKPTS